MRIGEKLKEERERQGLSQKDVGDRSKLSGCGEFDGVGTIVPCLTG